MFLWLKRLFDLRMSASDILKADMRDIRILMQEAKEAGDQRLAEQLGAAYHRAGGQLAKLEPPKPNKLQQAARPLIKKYLGESGSLNIHD